MPNIRSRIPDTSALRNIIATTCRSLVCQSQKSGKSSFLSTQVVSSVRQKGLKAHYLSTSWIPQHVEHQDAALQVLPAVGNEHLGLFQGPSVCFVLCLSYFEKYEQLKKIWVSHNHPRTFLQAFSIYQDVCVAV